MTILDLNAPGYTMLHWLTILLENREFDTSAPLAAEAKEYLMNTFHLDYKSADIIIGYRADDSYFSFASDFINGAISYRQLCNAIVESRSEYSGETGFSKNPSGMFMINPPTCLFNNRCRKADAYLNTVGAGLERVSDVREIG